MNSISFKLCTRSAISVTYLVAVVADGLVGLVAAGVGLLLEVLRDLGSKNSRLEGVLGVVAVDVLGEARVAKIEVLAVLAVEELRSRELCTKTRLDMIHTKRDIQLHPLTLNAAVAGAAVAVEAQLGHALLDRLPGDLALLARSDGLGGAGDDLATLVGGALDQPVVAAVAGSAVVDAGLAEIEVTVLAGGAVVVDIGDGLLAVVAADGESGGLDDGGTIGGALDGEDGLSSNAGGALLAGDTQLEL